MRRVCVIANPASGRGRGSRIIPHIRSVLAEMGGGDLRITSSQGEEPGLVRRALDDGFDTLIASGGDGTWSNVANAILNAGAGANVRLGLLAAGTGNDFAKTVGAPVRDIRETVRLALEGPDVAIDVGRIEKKYFINLAGFGVDVAVIENLDNVRWLQGDALYFYSGLREVFGYPGFELDLKSANSDNIQGRQLILIIANAKNFGGVFQLAPQASVVDGHLDAVAIRNTPPLRRLRLFLAAASGGHLDEPEVQTGRSRQFQLRFQNPPAYETDGEYNRAESNELEVTCVPKALRVVTPVELTS
ncbi:MAG TPA: diacylglycerol kinase family protein [Gemmatimonadaceae bacterium]